jgi:hypothetical protein
MEQAHDPRIDRLEVFVGEWTMEASIPGAPPASAGAKPRTTFEWLPGRRFLLQRWEVPGPVAPDGLAVIGVEPDGDGYLQHYFDERGVVRLYAMTLADRVWELRREKPDFSPLNFSQRFRGTFSDDNTAITGRWEHSRDGSPWELDFDLSYTKVA